MPPPSMSFFQPPEQWSPARRKTACRAALRGAKASVRQGRKALEQGDCGTADLHRVAAVGLVEAMRQVCSACAAEKAESLITDAFALNRDVQACWRG